MSTALCCRRLLTVRSILVVAPACSGGWRGCHFPSVLLWLQLSTDVIGRYLSGLYFSSFQDPFPRNNERLALSPGVLGWLEWARFEMKLSYSYIPGLRVYARLPV